MQVSVQNNSDKEYVERWDGREIRIPARGSINMSRAEAVTFLGQYTAPDKDEQGRPIAPKPLRMVAEDEDYAEHTGQPKKHACKQCSAEFRTQSGIQKHIDNTHIKGDQVVPSKNRG